MTTFLVIGGVGVALLLISVVVGDFVHGVFEGLGTDLFSGVALAGLLGAFGFVGALVYGGTGENLTLAIVCGLVAGLAVGAAVGWLSLKLHRGGDESNVRTADLAWKNGTIISAIPADGYGEVSVVAAGHITKLNARSSTPLPAGTPITITAVLSPTAVMVESLV